MNESLRNQAHSGSTGSGRIEILPGNRPNQLCVYLRDHRGVLHKLPQKETDAIMAKLAAQ